ncbi:unnamed protein product, partial [Urochloa humidicola]
KSIPQPVVATRAIVSRPSRFNVRAKVASPRWSLTRLGLTPSLPGSFVRGPTCSATLPATLRLFLFDACSAAHLSLRRRRPPPPEPSPPSLLPRRPRLLARRFLARPRRRRRPLADLYLVTLAYLPATPHAPLSAVHRRPTTRRRLADSAHAFRPLASNARLMHHPAPPLRAPPQLGFRPPLPCHCRPPSSVLHLARPGAPPRLSRWTGS